jgi:ABC-type iron transport system FetAB permease component
VWLNDMKLKEVNNGRVAMVAISGMVAQELVNGLNLIPADEVLEMGKAGALEAMEAQCTGATNEAACAKAFEAAERAAVFAANM